MRTILVTGATGFAGRWAVADLIARGHSVRVLDLVPNPANLDEMAPGLSKQVEILSGDVSAPSVVADAAKGCDGIVHLAGIMTVACAADPVAGATVNVIGSLRVFEAARQHGIRKVAWMSSAGVFGPHDAVNPQPHTHYGAFKLAIEGSARAYWQDHGIASVGLRPYIVYGPGQSSGIASGPSVACRAAHDGTSATIKFTGRVGFVHVADVGRALAAAMDAPIEGAIALTMNGASGEIAEFLAELEAQVPGSAARITVDGPPMRIPTNLKSDPMPAMLGDQPVTGLTDGIAQTLAFYRALDARG